MDYMDKMGNMGSEISDNSQVNGNGQVKKESDKTKIELDKDTVSRLMKLKSEVGDTYTIIVEMLLDFKDEVSPLHPEKFVEIGNRIRESRKVKESTQQLDSA
jgi:hypothetical protein